MDEKNLNKIRVLLTEWNPLGKQAKYVTDLNNYESEAADILWCLNKHSKVGNIEKSTKTVLSQAFGIQVDPVKCKSFAIKVHTIINEK